MFEGFLRLRGSAIAACLMMCLVLPVGLIAKQDAATGSLSGSVSDPSGKPLQSAVVSVQSESASSLVKKTTTDLDGHFNLTGLPAGTYKVEITAQGFATNVKTGQQVGTQAANLDITLSVATLSQAVTVEAEPTSLASETSPVKVSLDEHSPHSEINQATIENFDSPVADFTSILQMAPGTFSVSPNGVGLGQSNTYFRGFSDGQYTITFDGIPFEDTNSPTHHSWAFFPSQWIGGVDFDRSPGSASTIGPTNFGGSINLASREETASPDIRVSASYGSFQTRLFDLSMDSGQFGNGKSSLLVDVHQLLSSGYQTFNKQKRDAGSLKYQYKLSEQTTITLFTGVVDLWTNTPNFNGPTRGQVAQYGDDFLLTGSPSSPTFFGYNYYHVQTDFEYIGIKSDLGHGWKFDNKAYTYRYWNKQNYNSTTAINATSAVDKLNGYRKAGDTVTLSQESRYGILRVGAWYEWAYTDRYQNPTSPITGVDTLLPNFHEHFITQSMQPYAEYELKLTERFSIKAGVKLAYYNMALQQYADNGKTVGNLGGASFVKHSAGYDSWLPSVDANYRLTNNWSLYGQYAMGSVIPPSSVFDVKNAVVETIPKPTNVRTFQVGSVAKFKRVSADVDGYYSHFQNAYSSTLDPTTGEPVYYLTPDSITKGVEAEGNIYIGAGVSVYANATAGNAKYVGSELWVQNAPRNTQSIGLTYQWKNWDFGFFDKRIGQMYNDNGSTHEAVTISPFSVVNMYINYTVKNQSYLRDSKIRLSFNNLLNNQSIVGVIPASTATSVASTNDVLTILAPRSIMVSFTAGFAPKR